MGGGFGGVVVGMLNGELVVDESCDPEAGAKGTVCGKSSVFIPVQGALRLKY